MEEVQLSGYRFTLGQVRDAITVALRTQQKRYEELLQAANAKIERIEEKCKDWLQAISPIQALELIKKPKEELDLWELDALLQIASKLFTSQNQAAAINFYSESSQSTSSSTSTSTSSTSTSTSTRSANYEWCFDELIHNIASLSSVDNKLCECVTEVMQMIETNMLVGESDLTLQRLRDEFVLAYSQLSAIPLESSACEVVQVVCQSKYSAVDNQAIREYFDKSISNFMAHSVSVVSRSLDPLPVVECSKSFDSTLVLVCASAVSLRESIRRRIIRSIDILEVAHREFKMDPSFGIKHLLESLISKAKESGHCSHSLSLTIERIMCESAHDEGVRGAGEATVTSRIASSECTFCQQINLRINFQEQTKVSFSKPNIDRLTGWDIAEGIDSGISSSQSIQKQLLNENRSSEMFIKPKRQFL